MHRRRGADPAIWQICMHSNGLRTACQLTSPTNPEGCRQPNIPKTPHREPAATILPALACVRPRACLCVLSGDGFTSVAVPLCSSWRQGCLPWMGIACCPHTHSARSPAQTSAPTSPLLQTQARTARTRSLCFWLWRVCAGPFSLASEPLSLAHSLAVTLPPTLIGSPPLLSTPPSPLPSDSLGCDNPF